MEHNQISARMVLAVIGMMSFLAVAIPTGNSSISSNALLPRAKQKDKAFVKICSGFNFGGYCETLHAEVISVNYLCQPISQKMFNSNGGVSSITIHKAWCRFYTWQDCIYNTTMLLAKPEWIDLPFKDAPPKTSTHEKLEAGNTGVCNLSGLEHGNTGQWDNKITAYMCEPAEGTVLKEPKCN